MSELTREYDLLPAGASLDERSAHLGSQCGVGADADANGPAAERAMYLFLPELGTWDCYPGASVDEIAAPMRAPCACASVPAIAAADAPAIGLACALALCVAAALAGGAIDALRAACARGWGALASLQNGKVASLSGGGRHGQGGGAAAASDTADAGVGADERIGRAAWRLRVLLGGALQAADVTADVLVLVALIALGDGCFAAASAAILLVSIATTRMYTLSPRAVPVMRPELGDTVRMARRGTSGRVVELVDAASGAPAGPNDRAGAHANRDAASGAAEGGAHDRLYRIADASGAHLLRYPVRATAV